MSDTQVDINTVVINETKNQESDENDSSKSLNRRKRCLLDAQHRRNVGLTFVIVSRLRTAHKYHSCATASSFPMSLILQFNT
jgi:hypothetical protein